MSKALEKRIKQIEEKRGGLAGDEEFRQHVAESEAFFAKASAEFNSPAEVAKREAAYQRLCEIGRLREAAFKRGEPMDTYPLPWRKIETIPFEEFVKG